MTFVESMALVASADQEQLTPFLDPLAQARCLGCPLPFAFPPTAVLPPLEVCEPPLPEVGPDGDGEPLIAGPPDSVVASLVGDASTWITIDPLTGVPSADDGFAAELGCWFTDPAAVDDSQGITHDPDALVVAVLLPEEPDFWTADQGGSPQAWVNEDPFLAEPALWTEGDEALDGAWSPDSGSDDSQGEPDVWQEGEEHGEITWNEGAEDPGASGDIPLIVTCEPVPESEDGWAAAFQPTQEDDPSADADPDRQLVEHRPYVPMPWWRGSVSTEGDEALDGAWIPDSGSDDSQGEPDVWQEFQDDGGVAWIQEGDDPASIGDVAPIDLFRPESESVEAWLGEPLLSWEDDSSEDPGSDHQGVETRPLVPMPWWRGAEVFPAEPGDDSVTLDASLPTFIKELPPEVDVSFGEPADAGFGELAVCWFDVPSPSVLELTEPDPIPAEGADDPGLCDFGSSWPESWNVPAVVIDPMPEFLVDEPLGSHDEAGGSQLWATDFDIKMTVMVMTMVVVDGSQDTQIVPLSLHQQEDPIFGDVQPLALEAPGEDVPFVLDSGLGMYEDTVLSSDDSQAEEMPGAASDPFIPMPWWRGFTSLSVTFEPDALSQDTPSGDETADMVMDADEMVTDVQVDAGPLDGPVLIDEAGAPDDSLLLDGPRVGFFNVAALDAPSEVAELVAGLEPMTAAEPEPTPAPVDPDPSPAQSIVAAIAAARAPLPPAPVVAAPQSYEPVAAEPDPVGNTSAATRAAGLSGPIASPVIPEAVTPPLAPPPPTATQDVAGDLSGLSPEDPSAEAFDKLLSLYATGSIGVEAPATWRDLDPDTLRLAASNRSL